MSGVGGAGKDGTSRGRGGFGGKCCGGETGSGVGRAVQGCVEAGEGRGDPCSIFLPREPGVYVLLVCVPSALAVRVGSLGVLELPEGHYAYVGSAMGGIRRRCRRYLLPPGRMRWHVDFLLSRACLQEVHWLLTHRRLECAVAESLSRLLEPVARGFGTSDCRCPTHLFYGRALGHVRSAVVAALRATAWSPFDPACDPGIGQGGGEVER